MGGCFSKKKDNKKDSSLKVKGEKSEDSRDPPPTESPQEEKVKEVLSETSKIIRSTSISNGSVKILEKKEKDPAICCDVDRSEADTASESTTTTTTTFREKMAREIEEEEGEIEMKNIRSVSTSRSRSPAKTQKKINRSSFRDAAAKREIRGVDVGCRSARSSPLPVLRARESGNASMRNRPCNSTSSSHNNNNYKISSNNNKRDVGERSGRRSVSPAIKRSAVPMMMMDQRQCRSGTSLSATTATASATTASRVNGRSSPQRERVPVVDLESSSRGQNGNINAAAAGGNGGTMEAEESLENPLVSLECFIFL